MTVQELFKGVETINQIVKEINQYGKGQIVQLYVDGLYENEFKTFNDFDKWFKESFTKEVVDSFTGNLEYHECIGYGSWAEHYDDDDPVRIEFRLYK